MKEPRLSCSNLMKLSLGLAELAPSYPPILPHLTQPRAQQWPRFSVQVGIMHMVRTSDICTFLGSSPLSIGPEAPLRTADNPEVSGKSLLWNIRGQWGRKAEAVGIPYLCARLWGSLWEDLARQSRSPCPQQREWWAREATSRAEQSPGQCQLLYFGPNHRSLPPTRETSCHQINWKNCWLPWDQKCSYINIRYIERSW